MCERGTKEFKRTRKNPKQKIFSVHLGGEPPKSAKTEGVGLTGGERPFRGVAMEGGQKEGKRTTNKPLKRSLYGNPVSAENDCIRKRHAQVATLWVEWGSRSKSVQNPLTLGLLSCKGDGGTKRERQSFCTYTALGYIGPGERRKKEKEKNKNEGCGER